MGQCLALLCPDANDDGPPKPGPEPEPEYKHNTIEDLKKQKYEDIIKKLVAENSSFEDPLFPKTKSSIGPIGPRASSLESIKWMRAQDIASNPVLVTDGTTRFDINQGALGDCWFLATLANLPAHPKVFNKVMDKNQTFDKNPGIFRFKFWQYGEWIEVVVDDYLPTVNGKLLFLQSNSPNEFWTPLLEKAYAKLYGNYTLALDGGLIGSSMEDLSGGVAESYHDKGSPAPFKVMLRSFQKKSMMGALIWTRPGETIEQINEIGLAGGHAYSVTKVLEFEVNGEKHQLVRIRNPWGTGVGQGLEHGIEWKGAWSDKSPEWNALSDTQKNEIGLLIEDNGEFFMTYQDFIKHFDGIDICHVSMDSFDEDNIGWHKQEVHGSWSKGTSDGGLENLHENPQYLVELKDTDADSDNICTCLISLLQVGGRRKRADGQSFETAFAPIGFALIPVAKNELPLSKDAINGALEESKVHVALLNPYGGQRANTKRFEVPPGKYILLPFTDQSNKELKFLLRLFSEMPAKLELVN